MSYGSSLKTCVISFVTVISLAAALPVAAQTRNPCIGASLPMTGPTAWAAESIRLGAEIAIEEINAAGGVLGQQLSFKMYDDAGQPPRGVDNARRIAEQDNCIAMFGGWHSGVALAFV